jgi:hypothetical protein
VLDWGLPSINRANGAPLRCGGGVALIIMQENNVPCGT